MCTKLSIPKMKTFNQDGCASPKGVHNRGRFCCDFCVLSLFCNSNEITFMCAVPALYTTDMIRMIVLHVFPYLDSFMLFTDLSDCTFGY